MESHDEFRDGYQTLPDVDLTLSAARFIQAFHEDFRQTYQMGSFEGSFNTSVVSLYYTYARKELFEGIRKNGFPAQTRRSVSCLCERIANTREQ